MLRNIMIVIFALFLIGACNRNNEDAPGYLEGMVTDAVQGDPLSEVRIIVFDANTNSPVGNSSLTDKSGEYSIEIETGTYFLKLFKLGYNDIPGKGAAPLPINVPAGENVITNYEMKTSDVANGGVISGKVASDGSAVKGVLIVAENESDAFSSVSDADGNYFIYNVIPGNYGVKGWKAEYNSNQQDVSLGEDEKLEDVNLVLTLDAAAGISGAITFLATENIEVDISLVHPMTKETVPGLSTMTANYNYLITNVPDGTYLARASYANDNKVMDPDWIIKNGEPYVTITGADAVLNFSITDAVTLHHPTNEPDSVVAEEIPLDSAIFRWEPYPSANDYVIELSDASGNVIWGGFSADWNTKNITIPSSSTEVDFNFDQSASETLKPGKIYRWKVYASKDDKQSATGWRLISASEDQMGLFKILE